MMALPLPGREKHMMLSSAISMQCTSVTDGQTDVHRPTASTALAHRRRRFCIDTRSVAWEPIPF